MRLAALLALGALALSACSDPPPPSTERGAARGRGPAPAPIISPSGLPPTPGAAQPSRSSRARTPAPPPLPPPGAGGGEPSATASERGQPIQDRLRQALQRAFGTPIQCVGAETRRRLSDRLVVQVQVSVASAGRVTRASVSSSQLAREDLECMRRHAETLRLATEIPDAPRTVTASVEYDVTPEGQIETTRELPEVPPVAGRVAPDSTLPAAGTVDDRPAGSVAPDHTLEREGTVTSRPAGSVPPSFTLPARVE